MRSADNPELATAIRYACGLVIGVAIASANLVVVFESHPADYLWVLGIGALSGLFAAWIPGSAPPGGLPVDHDDWIFHALGFVGLLSIPVLWNAV